MSHMIFLNPKQAGELLQAATAHLQPDHRPVLDPAKVAEAAEAIAAGTKPAEVTFLRHRAVAGLETLAAVAALPRLSDTVDHAPVAVECVNEEEATAAG